MISPDKIEEWIKEAQERPESASLIIQHIANRLRDLTNQNEVLKTDNIALQSGERVQEFQQRIRHLEYQLDLLKRQFGGELTGAPGLAPQPAVTQTTSLLVYTADGHVLRLAASPQDWADGSILAHLQGDLAPGGEAPRLLVVPSSEELLWVFSSGRVAAMPAEAVSAMPLEAAQHGFPWRQAPVPDEPRAGERLACLAPVSRLALADYFVQASRRGYLKKINASLAASILANHYIGTAVNLPADRSFDLLLGSKDDRLCLVSREGYLLCLDAKGVAFSIEEAMRLEATDHLVSLFALDAQRSILAMTQVGKLIHWPADQLEVGALKTKGQALFSPQRRSQRVRVVGAAAAAGSDWGLALHQDGRLTVHAMGALFDRGTLETQGELLAFTVFPAAQSQA